MASSEVKSTRWHSNLLMNTDLSDLTIKVESKHFPVHKIVFSSLSPVFRDMIQKNEDHQTIEINDISPDLFYVLLRYIYNNTLEIISTSDFFTFLRFFNKYKINNLQDVCIEELEKRDITEINFWDFWNHYDRFNEVMTLQMKIKTLNFLGNKFSWFSNHAKFLFLSQKSILKIVSSNTLVIPETDLCIALVNWAIMQCNLNLVKPSTQNQRIMLGDVIYQLRLCTMTPHALLNNPIMQLLTEKERAIIMAEPNLLTEPWDYNLLCKERENLCFMPLVAECTPYFSNKTSYIVFSKDVFIHRMYVAPHPDVTEIRIQPLNGIDQLIRCAYTTVSVKNLVYHEIKRMSMKAFVVYALEIDSDTQNIQFHDKWVSKECAVILKGNDQILKNYDKFTSCNYWKDYFANDCKDESFITTEDKKKSFIYYMEVSC